MFHELDRHLLKITAENPEGMKVHTYIHTYLLIYLLFYLHTYLLTYLLTYRLTPWNTVLLEKLTGSVLVKKSPVFYGTRRFIILFTSARHLSLPEPDQSSPSPIPLPEVPS
jgi:hypothetical protein